MLKRALMLAAALAVGSTGTASAAGSWSATNICGGGLFITCASVSVSWTGNVVTLTATNTATNGELWKAVGLVNLAAGGTFLLSGQPGYVLPPPNDLNNFPGIRAVAVTNDKTKMIANGGTGTWSFTFSGLTVGEMDQAMATSWFAVHAIDGPGGCSTKVAIQQDGTTYATEGQSAECVPDDPPLNVVPEPATMVLLATGLLGLAGANLRRRRKA